MNGLPKGWCSIKLGDVCRVQTGFAFKSKDYLKSGIPLIRISNLINGQVQVQNDTVFLPQSYAATHEECLLRHGNTLVALSGATTGKLATFRLEIPALLNQRVGRFLWFSDKATDSKYFDYVVQSLSAQITAEAYGGAQPNISPDKIAAMECALPPINEQRRIAAKLEQVVNKVFDSQKRLAKIPVLLKRFRQSVLAAACSGRLTADWRENNGNHSWDEKTLGELEEFIGSGVTPKGGRSVYVETGVPFIRSQNVYPSGLILDDVAYVTKEMHKQMSRTHLRPRDVLLNITGASIGRSTVVPEGFVEGNVNQHVCIIRVKPSLSPKFLSMFFNSPVGQNLIFDTQVGVTREGLNYSQIRAFAVPVPSMNEQQEIFRRVDELFALTSKIEIRYKKAQAQVDKLTQSILGKAFRGELVTQDPTDEPASELLKRIKTQKKKQ